MANRGYDLESQQCKDTSMVTFPNVKSTERTITEDKKNLKEVKTTSQKADEYAEGLTIHGLSKVLLGSSIVERMFWAFALLLAIAMAIFMVKTLAMKFFNHEVYIDSTMVKTKKHIFPAVTFCNIPFEKNKFCGRHRGHMQSSSYICPNSIIPIGIVTYKALIGIATWNAKILSLGSDETNKIRFKFSCGLECEMSYISDEYLKVTKESLGNCVTWNWNRTFFNLKSKVEFSVWMAGKTFSGDIAVYVHDQEESPITMDYFIPSNVDQNLDLIFQKVVTEKINRSPPNDCVEEKNSEKDMFPGKYTISGCLDTHICKMVLQECGATLDFCTKYIPKAMTSKYQSYNTTNWHLHECIRKGFADEKFTVNPFVCPPSCKKATFRTFASSYVRRNRDHKEFDVRLMYQERNSYEKNVEKVVYSWEDLVSGVGGMIGLFCGFSLLSILELIVFIGLKLYGKKQTTNN